MFLYAGKVIVLTLIALCAVNFIGKQVSQILVGKSLLTQTEEAPSEKSSSIEFDPFTGKQQLTAFWAKTLNCIQPNVLQACQEEAYLGRRGTGSRTSSAGHIRAV